MFVLDVTLLLWVGDLVKMYHDIFFIPSGSQATILSRSFMFIF